MKAVVFSDIHIHPFSQFSAGSGGLNLRLALTLRRLEEIIALANEQNVPLIFGGDFFHDRLRLDVVSLIMATGALSSFKGTLFACSGTHDQPRRGFSSLDIFRNLPSPKVFLDEIVKYEEWTIYLVPDPLEVPCEQKISSLLLPGHNPQRAILVTHAIVSHEKERLSMFGRNLLDASFLSKNFRLSIVGHVHEGKYLADSRILIPGPAIPNSFGDGEGMAWFIEVTDKKLVVEPIRFPHPAFKTIMIRTPEDISSLEINENDFYRLIVEDESLLGLLGPVARLQNVVLAVASASEEESSAERPDFVKVFLDVEAILKGLFAEEKKRVSSPSVKEFLNRVDVERLIAFLMGSSREINDQELEEWTDFFEDILKERKGDFSTP